MHGQWRCEHEGRKWLLIINNLRRELVVQGSVSSFMLDKDGLSQKAMYEGVVEDCVCNPGSEVGIHSSFKHMERQEKIPDQQLALRYTPTVLDTSATQERGCGLADYRAFKTS